MTWTPVRKSTPFKSGITDYDAIRARLKEIGTWPPVIGGEHGISVEKKPAPPPEAAPYYPDVYA